MQIQAFRFEERGGFYAAPLPRAFRIRPEADAMQGRHRYTLLPTFDVIDERPQFGSHVSSLRKVQIKARK